MFRKHAVAQYSCQSDTASTYDRAVQVKRFIDEYSAVARLYGVTPSELNERDRQSRQNLQRWIAISGSAVVGAVSLWKRPDNRTFARFVGDPSAVDRLSHEAALIAGPSLYVSVEESEAELVQHLTAAGFRAEGISDGFDITFSSALDLFGKSPLPSGFSIVSAGDVDRDRLFTLDNTLRQDVPGCDGWRGDRQWFFDELEESPPFDPGAYLVGLDKKNDEFAGLIRIWRNPSGPKLGLVGVARQYRNSMLAPALLRKALEASSTWGFSVFKADVSPSNDVVYPRMRRLNAVQTSRHMQMVRLDRQPSAGDARY